jgi:hypothetical protein
MADTYEFAEANEADKATAHEYAFDDEHVDMHESDIARLLAGARKAERERVLAETDALAQELSNVEQALPRDLDVGFARGARAAGRKMAALVEKLRAPT